MNSTFFNAGAMGLMAGLLMLGVLLTDSGVYANPFTQKQPPVVKTEQEGTGPGSGLSLTIVRWQQQLRQKMSQLIRKARENGQYGPVALVLALGLAYGVVHSAGPGHGKAAAASYVMGARPGLVRGVLFAVILAFTHAGSGMLLVIMVKAVLHYSVNASLEQVTRITRQVSFSLILALGGYLFVDAVIQLRAKSHEKHKDEKPVLGLFAAVAMGLIPCPGVVMTTLFCLSMDALGLGIALGAAIGTGMAFTLSTVVVLAIMGRQTLVAGAARLPWGLARPEALIQAVAGVLVAALGGLFLLT